MPPPYTSSQVFSPSSQVKTNFSRKLLHFLQTIPISFSGSNSIFGTRGMFFNPSLNLIPPPTRSRSLAFTSVCYDTIHACSVQISIYYPLMPVLYSTVSYLASLIASVVLPEPTSRTWTNDRLAGRLACRSHTHTPSSEDLTDFSGCALFAFSGSARPCIFSTIADVRCLPSSSAFRYQYHHHRDCGCIPIPLALAMVAITERRLL